MFRQAKLYAAAALLLAAFAAGWMANGWRLTAKLETERRQVAEDARKQVEAANAAELEAEQAQKRAEDAYQALRRNLPRYAEQERNNVAANPRDPACRLPEPDVRVRQSQEREAKRWTQ